MSDSVVVLKVKADAVPSWLSELEGVERLRDGAFLPVGRLYGDLYARTGDRFAVPRVTPEEAKGERPRAVSP